MSWRDRDDPERDWRRMGRPGGDWQGMRPTLDNPMTWAVMLGRVGGISIRVHILFLLFIVITLLRAMAPPGKDETFTWFSFNIVAIGLLCLFTIVLVHEFGHCLACRWTGGEADEILMWPLGGLAFCRPPHRWKSNLITAVGGPAVNVLFCLVAGLMLGLQTGHWIGVALPNPLDPYSAMLSYEYGIGGSWPLIALYLINWTSLVLLLFNLLPIFPLDGGRIVQAFLWRDFGYTRSMRFSVRVGYVGAILLGIWGAVTGEWILLGIAIFGGVTCYLTYRQLEFTEAIFDGESEVYAATGPDLEEAERPERVTLRQRRAERRARREAEEVGELDRILDKIAASGMDSLTGRERRLLRRMTERKRRGQGDG